jgi:hypothetical protein
MAQYQDPYLMAQGQIQDPHLAGQVDVHDDLDAIYDQINAQARQRPVEQIKPVKDQHAYDQFMNQTQANLQVEAANLARVAEARRVDALTTGQYEQKRINEQAALDRAQIQANALSSGGYSRHRSRSLYAPTYAADPNNPYATATPTTSTSPSLQAVENRRQAGIAQSQDNVNSRIFDNQVAARARDEALTDTAENLRDQILSTQSSPKAFGLQGVGTNLYVRQYIKPDTPLPPVHNAAARIVPAGSLSE